MADIKVKDSGLPMYTPPGISFTAPEKSRPWQQPPKLTKLEDVINFYMRALSDTETVDGVLDSLETGVALAPIAESIMLGGVSQGVHTIDAGVLVMPIIIEMLITAATINNTEYVVFSTDIPDDKVPARAAKQAAKIAIESLNSNNEMPVEEMSEMEEPEMEQSMGLMSKKNVEV